MGTTYYAPHVDNAVFLGLTNARWKTVNSYAGNFSDDVTVAGELGVGTTTPDAMLQVVGDAKIGDDNTNYAAFASDGELTLAGTARVTRHIPITPGAMKVTGGSHGEAGCFTYVNFRAGQDDESYFVTHIPYRRTVATTMAVTLYWYYTGVSEPTHAAEWNLSYCVLSLGDDPGAAGTALAEIGSTAPTNHLQSVSFTLPSAGLVNHENLGIKIWRDGSDDLTADARLIAAHVHFTMDKLGQPTT